MSASRWYDLETLLRPLEKYCLEDVGDTEEIREFANECIQLLLRAPDCQMSFKNFAKIYARLFEKPLNQKSYGFKSLTDLLRAMPETVEVSHKFIDWDGTSHRGMIQLTESAWQYALANKEKYSLTLGVKANQIEDFARDCIKVLILAPECKLPLYRFKQWHELQFKRTVMASDYGVRRLSDLIRKVPETVELAGSQIQLNETIRCNAAEEKEKCHPKLTVLEKDLVELQHLLWGRGKVTMNYFRNFYERYFLEPLEAENYGDFKHLKTVLALFPNIVKMEGKKPHVSVMFLPPQNNDGREDEREDLECIVCMDLKPDVVLVPCTHNNLCHSCANKIYQEQKKCPIDRIKITDIIPLSMTKEV